MAQITECISEVCMFIIYFESKEINLYNLYKNNKINNNKYSIKIGKFCK